LFYQNLKSMKKILVIVCIAFLVTNCNNNSGWSAADRDKGMKSCLDGVAGKVDDATAKQYCSCVLGKIMPKYKTYDEADKALTEEDGRKVGLECTQEIQNGKDKGVLGNKKAGGWSKQDEDKWMSSCIKVQPEDNQQSRALCSCVMQKAEKKYSTYEEEERLGTADEGRQWSQECANGGDNGTGDNENKNNPLGNIFGNNNNGGGWTDQQRQEFVQGCSGIAQQKQGFTVQEANNYCDCMQKKMEKKFSYTEYTQLTGADMQTPEWRQAMIDCGARQQ
jgi:hypothetical protein